MSRNRDIRRLFDEAICGGSSVEVRGWVDLGSTDIILRIVNMRYDRSIPDSFIQYIHNQNLTVEDTFDSFSFIYSVVFKAEEPHPPIRKVVNYAKLVIPDGMIIRVVFDIQYWHDRDDNELRERLGLVPA